MYYYIEWGDDTAEEWIGPYPSGEIVTVKHTWSEEGLYCLRVKAKDNNGLESGWGTLEVTMPKNKAINTPFLNFLENFLENHPLIYQLLQRVLNL